MHYRLCVDSEKFYSSQPSEQHVTRSNWLMMIGMHRTILAKCGTILAKHGQSTPAFISKTDTQSECGNLHFGL